MTSRFLGLLAAFALLHLGCSGDSAPIDRLVASRDRLALATDTGGRIALVAEDFHFTSGYLSVSGRAQESENSSFILKGEGKDLYGWVVLHDKDVAYEYTTSDQGELVVERVPVSKIFPICDPDPDPATDSADFADSPAFDMSVGNPPHVGMYDGRDPSKLQSNPGATKVLFMDIAALTLPKDQLWRAWQVVAASFSAFEVNVTTDAAVFEAAEPRSRGKACARNEAGRSSCALNGFGTMRCCNIFNKGNGYYQGTTTAHELGHLMGLRHDGTTGGTPGSTAGGGEYFRGLAPFRWCPIMGASTPKTTWGQDVLFQWSKGEYTGASNKEDDLAILSKNLPFKQDDVPATKPLLIRNGSQVFADDNRGLIETNTDSDTFTFTVGGTGGRATLAVDRIEFVGGAFLDIDAQIQNASGTMLARSNEMVSRKATFDVPLPAGTYRLIIKGGAEGTPQNGFSSYSSLGYYGISGTITASVDTGDAGGGQGTDAGTDGPAGGGGMDAGGTPDADTRDAAAEAMPDAGMTTAGNGGAGGAGGGAGSGGTRAGTGGATGTGGRATPGETSRNPVHGGCAIDSSGGAASSAGTAMLTLATLLVGARRRRRTSRRRP